MLTSSSLLVQPLGISCLADLQGHLHVDLNELARLEALADLLTVSPVRRDERYQSAHTRVGKEL